MDEYKKRIFQRHKDSLIIGLVIILIALLFHLFNVIDLN